MPPISNEKQEKFPGINEKHPKVYEIHREVFFIYNAKLLIHKFACKFIP